VGNVIEIYEKILIEGTEQEVISFLQSLSDSDKKILNYKIKHLGEIYRKKVFTYAQTHICILQDTPDYKRWQYIAVSAFVCCEQNIFTDIFTWSHTYFQIITAHKVYLWGMPSWFATYLEKHPFMLDSYERLLECIVHNNLAPTKETIIFQLHRKAPITLESFPSIFLEEHLWYIFEVSEEIIHFDSKSWSVLFQRLLENGDIPLQKLLMHLLEHTPVPMDCLETLNRLDIPSSAYMEYQKVLICTLDATERKRVNLSLKLIKKICENALFDDKYFIDYLPMLLHSSVKMIRNSTLSIVVKLLKKSSNHHSSIAVALGESLLHKDSQWQIKVIKLLQKYDFLKEEYIRIADYEDALFMEAKALITEYTPDIDVSETVIVTQAKAIELDNTHIIDMPQTFEERIFVLSRTFEKIYIDNFDRFMHLLLKIDSQVNTDNVDKLIPLIQTAYKKATVFNYNLGLVTYICLDTMLRYAQYLTRVFPDSKMTIDSILKEKPYFSSLIENPYFYKPFVYIAFLVQQKILDKEYSPLLSFATHSYGYIDINILIERIAYYQKNAIAIDLIDFQIAVLRVVISKDKIEDIKQKISGEISDVLLYLFSENTLDIIKVKTPELWITALLRSDKEDELDMFAEHFDKGLLFPYQMPIYQIGEIDYTFYSTAEQRYLKDLSKVKTVNIIPTYFEHPSRVANIFTMIHHNRISQDLHKGDDEKFLLLSPHITDRMLLFFIRVHGYDRNYLRANSMRHAEQILPVLSELWHDAMHEYNYVYLACSLVDKSSSVRFFGSELWYKATTEGTMNHQLLGEILGKLEYNEYAPLKRFTDLIISNMLNLSNLHNEGLHILLSAMITQMNDVPIKGIKKLLEIYLEVLSFTGIGVPKRIRRKLQIWVEVKSLKGVAKKLLT